MGCDIHPHLELKINGRWYYVGQPVHGRDYILFGQLSGVRAYNGEEKFFKTEHDGVGMPEDLTDEVTKLYDNGWGGDAHTLTIITYSGLKDFIKFRGNSIYGSASGGRKSDAHDWLEIMNKLIDYGVEDARLIIWFDN